MKRKILQLAAPLIAVFVFPNAHAAVIGLDFEGVGNSVGVLNFYNGGTDGAGNMGTDYGVQFLDNTLALIDLEAGGSGNFDNAPSPDTVMFFLEGSAVLNFAAGFDTGFSFFYSASSLASVVPIISIYDGLGGTGNVLGTIELAANWQDGGCDTGSGQFCHWDPIGTTFMGTALSIVFGGQPNLVGYDNITFGSATPVPLPAAVWLLGSALLGYAGVRRLS